MTVNVKGGFFVLSIALLASPAICHADPIDSAAAAPAEPATAEPAIALAQVDPAPAPREWTPLKFGNFGKEFTERWIPVPNGTSGAPRQGWLATADGFFTREFHLAYDYTDSRGPDAHEVLVRFNYPLSRRFWAGLEVPFYQRLTNGRDNFGDITLSTLVMLAETRNLSINAGVGWRLPTGSVLLGNNRFSPTPQVNVFTDIGHGFSLRGRVGYQIGDRTDPDAVVVNATIGQTVTPHSKTPFGDLTWYVAANWSEPVTRNAPSFVSITPGLRTHLGGNLFLLGGVTFPVTPYRNSFRERFIVQIVQGF